MPDVIVDAPKYQQISGGPLLRESALHGALANPGALEHAPTATGGHEPLSRAESIPSTSAGSAPIKAEFIGKPDDAQLKAAFAYLDHVAGTKADSH